MTFKKGNKDAEKWTIEAASDLFDRAFELVSTGEYDFIGELTTDLNETKDIFIYLSDKYKELKPKWDKLRTHIEASCFRNAKKNKINSALAIINLKSNYGWTDRQRIDSTVEHSGLTIKVDSKEKAEDIERINDRTD